MVWCVISDYSWPAATSAVIPYTLSENDMKFVAPNGFTTGDQFFEYLRDHLDYLVREARLGEGAGGGAVGKLMSVGLHCRVVGRPGRMAGLEKFLGGYTLPAVILWHTLHNKLYYTMLYYVMSFYYGVMHFSVL